MRSAGRKAPNTEMPDPPLKYTTGMPRPADEAAAKLHDLLATLWCRSEDLIAERLEVLRSSYRRLLENSADEGARRTGADAAHKLAGILGTFGLPAGTEFARQTEVALEARSPLTAAHLASMRDAIEQLEAMIRQKSREIGPRSA
jgi:HPt (histidine-containing phosphotransfer) domain-containing protein